MLAANTKAASSRSVVLPQVQRKIHCAAAVQSRLRVTSGAPQPRFSLMTKLSEAVEIDVAVAKFEVVAGRSAMLGFAVMVISELVTSSSIVPVNTIQANEALETLFFLLSTSATLAVVTSQRAPSSKGAGLIMLSEVLAVLTSGKSMSANERDANLGVALDKYLEDSTFPLMAVIPVEDSSDKL